MNRGTKVALAGLLAVPALVAARAESRRGCDLVRDVIGLSGDAAEKLTTVLKSGRKVGEPLHRRLHESLEKLRWQVDAEAGDKEIAATLEQVEKARDALRKQRESVKAEIDGLLTPEQRARMLLALGPMGMEPPPPPGGFKEGRGPGGPCGHGPRPPRMGPGCPGER